jgi:hypothetical protein
LGSSFKKGRGVIIMDKNPDQQIFGLTKKELMISVTLGGLLLCVIVLFGGYVLYDLNRSNPVAVLPPTSTPQPIVQSTNSPLPARPSNTPISQLTFTATPTFISVPTTGSPNGTYNNPVPIGIGYTYPGFGTLTVLESSWQSGQTGFAIVKLSFTCERPADQECDLGVSGRFMLSALGNSGNGYNQEFDSAIPRPNFGSFTNPPVYGGGNETGYVGFLITGNETSLLMRTQIFLQQGEVFFKISN